MGSTDRKRLSQQEVEESTEAVERLRSVVNHVLDGIITIDTVARSRPSTLRRSASSALRPRRSSARTSSC